ncbi:MAG: PDZ domain-containing protein [Myxococcota bacterium]
MRPARSVPTLLARVAPPVFSFGMSLALHLALTAPLFVLWWLDDQSTDELIGEEGTEPGPIGNDGGEVPLGEPDPVRVSMYVEPTEATAPAAEASTAPGPAAAAVTKPAASGPEGAADGDPNTNASMAAIRRGLKGVRPRGERKPCEDIEEITPLGGDKWRVERDVVDYYAVHLKELENQVGVNTHRDADGRPDGARIFLPRCSLLRQAGLRHGDIVNSINDRRVATLTDGIAAYLFLRNDENLRVQVTRKNGEKVTLRYRLKR